jgi:high-affinity Fe2+/Pb2+ permease
MKKINSIGYGGKVISVGILCAFIIPIIIFFFPYKCGLLNLVSKISLIAGILILLLFSIWLKIELYQDKKMNRYFENNKGKKLSIGDGIFECQACGNRQIKPSDNRCNVCGIKFM